MQGWMVGRGPADAVGRMDGKAGSSDTAAAAATMYFSVHTIQAMPAALRARTRVKFAGQASLCFSAQKMWFYILALLLPVKRVFSICSQGSVNPQFLFHYTKKEIASASVNIVFLTRSAQLTHLPWPG